MKLVQPDTIPNKGEGISFGDTKFRIGDEAMIIHLLRHKIYSNPVRVICQEIMSNGRDAHREVGEPLKPIVVTPPTYENPIFRVRDFGPGMTPQRMREVFVAYGLSTKRNDDSQTGGFGLGAKSPWSYTNWFEIVSITEDEEGKWRRHYRAYIDETRIGKLSLKDEILVDPDEPGQEIGVEVIVPVQPEDCSRFCEEILYVSDYWEMSGGSRPIIVNNVIKWTNFDKEKFDGDIGWAVFCHAQYGDNRKDRPLAIVDGIPYPIDISALLIDEHEANYSIGDVSISKVANDRIRLFFSSDEIDVTANRETLDYSARTIEVILFRFRNCFDALRKKVLDRIETCTNLWDALVSYKECDADFSNALPVMRLFDKVEWNGCKLYTSDIYYNAYKLYAISGNKMILDASHLISSFAVHKNAKLVVDNTGGSRPSRSRLRTVFLENPNISVCYVFVLPTDIQVNAIKALDKDIHLLQLNPIWLSMVEPTRVKQTRAPRVNGIKREIVKVHKYENGVWRSTDIDIANGTGYYIVRHYSNFFFDWGMQNYVSGNFHQYAKEWGVALYSITPSLKDKVGPHFTSFKVIMQEKLQEMLADIALQQYELEYDSYYANERLSFEIDSKLVKKLEQYNATHLILQYVKHLVICQDAVVINKLNMLKNLRNDLGVERGGDVKRSIISTLTKQIQQKYPFILMYRINESLRTIKGVDMHDKLYQYILAVDAGKL